MHEEFINAIQVCLVPRRLTKKFNLKFFNASSNVNDPFKRNMLTSSWLQLQKIAFTGPRNKKVELCCKKITGGGGYKVGHKTST